MTNTDQPVKAEIERWPLSKFLPYARNPRKNDNAVDRMVSSIVEFGFKVPVLARSTGEVVDGHLRLKAAQKMKLASVPVMLCDEWTEAQVKAFRIQINRSATWAEWDEELLSVELEDLNGAGFNLSLTGFDDAELSKYLEMDLAGQAPAAFNEYDENIDTEHECPKCGYRWSGGKSVAEQPPKPPLEA